MLANKDKLKVSDEGHALRKAKRESSCQRGSCRRIRKAIQGNVQSNISN